MRAVLDTSVLIADDVPAIDGEIAISAVSLAELHFGALLASDASRRAERLRRLALIARTFEALPVDHLVAASYGELASHVARHERTPRRRSMDLLIAATAHAHGARLVTRNPADFIVLDSMVDIVTV